MSKKKEEASVGRRDFFRKAGLGVGAAGAAAVGLSAKQGKAAEPAKSVPGAAGYRETAHVKKYYELSRF
jgi:hypothetical protein